MSNSANFLLAKLGSDESESYLLLLALRVFQMSLKSSFQRSRELCRRGASPARGPAVIGSYVRIVNSPQIMGTVKAARFDRGHVHFLFEQDLRFAHALPETWLSSAALEVCSRPTDEQVAVMNDKPTNVRFKYVRMVAAPDVRMGTIQAVRFEGAQSSCLFHLDCRFAYRFPDAWLQESEFVACERPTDEQIERINQKIEDLLKRL